MEKNSVPEALIANREKELRSIHKITNTGKNRTGQKERPKEQN